MDAAPQHQDLPQYYKYPGGTLHLAPLAFYCTGVGLLALVYWAGGLSIFSTLKGLFWVAFGLCFVLLGIIFEIIYRDQPGEIYVTKEGICCTLPWRRKKYVKWDEIREIRRGGSFNPKYTAWGIINSNPQSRIVITSELKGYKDLLQTIKAHATCCERFDPID